MGLHVCVIFCLCLPSFGLISDLQTCTLSVINNFSSAFVSCLRLCPLSPLRPLTGTQPLMMTQEEGEKEGERGKRL